MLYFFLRGSAGEKELLVSLYDPMAKYSLHRIDKLEISHDTKTFLFGIPSGAHILGLPGGQHVYLSAKVNSSLVVRAYTPVSNDEDQGYVDLVVKREVRCLSTWTTWLLEVPLTSEEPNGLLMYKGNGMVCEKKKEKKEQ
ncbi:NADH-cytochrome b5 reductase 2 isoform X1 [Xiphias gladius]|uniref:NADH-cytochrome b5 reductase 2 isoform X1 n=1 Tax=Xiphias gladius TaxID=8245 RepID=UPI001A97E758|nr:NADH-cytochrome b5 reductase 2 isoform X1 [Xiphias gladius]